MTTQIDSSRAGVFSGLAADDINGDGRTDVVSGAYWYSNPGGNLLSGWTRSSLPDGMDGRLTLDVDSDGRTDIIAEGPIAGSTQVGVYWLRNNGQGASWTAYLFGDVPPDPTTFVGQGYTLAQLVPGGAPEIILTSGQGAYYFQVPANPTAGNWPRTLISPDIVRGGIAAADINRDGIIDVVGLAGPEVTAVAWWQNPGPGGGSWTRRDLGSTSGNPGDRVAVADVNHDGRPDVVRLAGGAADGRTLDTGAVLGFGLAGVP